MKRTLLLISLFVFKLSFSQIVDIVPAKDAGLKDSPNLYGFFTVGKNEIFHSEIDTKGKLRTFILEKYNSDLSQKFSQKFIFVEGEDKDLLEIKQNKIFLFTSYYDGKEKLLYLRILDNSTGKIITDKQKISSLPSDPFGLNGRNFAISFSPDESKMMVVSAFQWPKKSQVVKAEIYDLTSLKVINTFDIPDSYNNVMVKSRMYYLTDDGNVFYIVKTDIKDKDAPVVETMTLYNSKSKKFNYIEMPMEKKKVENSDSFIKNDILFYTGIFKDNYSKKDGKDNKAGVFCMAINLKDFKIITSDFNYFSAETELKLSYKDGQKKRELGEKEFTLKKLIKTSTGFYLVENLTYTVKIEGSNYTTYKPYSREFIVSKFDTNGKLEFIKIIPKNTTNKVYETDLTANDNDLYLFYCEHPKNLENYTLDNFDPKEYNDVGDLRGPVAVCVKVDAKGNLSRQVLFNNETWCYYPGAGVVVKEGKDIAIMEIQKDEYTLEVFRIKK